MHAWTGVNIVLMCRFIISCHCTQMRSQLEAAIAELEAALMEMKRHKLLSMVHSMEVRSDRMLCCCALAHST